VISQSSRYSVQPVRRLAASSKSQSERASALFFARAMRKPSHRTADKAVDKRNSQATAANDHIVILFIIAVSPGRRSIRKRDGNDNDYWEPHSNRMHQTHYYYAFITIRRLKFEMT